MPIQYKPIWPVNPNRALEEKDKFGAYRHGGRPHAGIDTYNKKDTEVRASLDGKVVRASDVDYGTYGKLVIIDHTPEILERRDGDDSYLLCYVYTLYAHLDSANAGLLGQEVSQGDVIGTVGNTGNARKMEPHLHFETVRSPVKLTWSPHGNTGVEAGKHRVDPVDFLNGFSLPEKCFEPLTDEEKERFYKEIETDFRTEPKPKLLVRLPDYKEFIRKSRGEYPSHGVKPPKVRLKFENMFSPAFRSFFPSVDLEVNGRNFGNIQTGTKVYELNVWG